MPIYVPGRRDRHNRPLRGGRRNILATLSLVAMVDMFTVLVVFLLQNYQTTGEAIDIVDEIKLPRANAVKELKPAHVVIISKAGLLLDKDRLATFDQVKQATEMRIPPLYDRLDIMFKEADAKHTELMSRIRAEAQKANPGVQKDDGSDERRVTVQADKSIDFLTIKKVMMTLTEAGASEINFAVIKDDTHQ